MTILANQRAKAKINDKGYLCVLGRVELRRQTRRAISLSLHLPETGRSGRWRLGDLEKILEHGFARELHEWEQHDFAVAEPEPSYAARPLVSRIITRPFRDQVFKRRVREAYQNTCAVSGLSLLNGGGRPEVQAAHIKPVSENGPDSVRNGLALTGTVHWLFDRGLISIDDDYRVLVSGHGVPDGLERLIRADRSLILPVDLQYQPHKSYLTWHRSHCFKP